MSLDGRVALVTGAFRGIGRAGVGNHPGLPGPQSPSALTPRSLSDLIPRSLPISETLQVV